MSYLIFILLLVIVFLLQPMQILIGLVMRFLWHPPALSDEMKGFQTKDMTDKPTKDIYTSRIQTLDQRFLQSFNDAGKFWSMYAWQGDDESAWQAVMRMVDPDNGTIHRNPREYWHQDERTFSGDQLAGFMGAVANRSITAGLSEEERKSLSIVWDNISFNGIPMVIPHYVTGKSLTLGLVWRPWQVWNIASFVKMLAWLCLGSRVTGKIKYSLFYWLILIAFFPSLMLCSLFGEFWVKNVFACSANASHSLVLDLSTWRMLTDSWISKFLMKKAGKIRGEWSTDWLALWGAYFDKLTEPQETLLKNLIWSTYLKHPYNSEDLTKAYYDILHFEKQSGYPTIETPEKKYHDYSDERPLTVPENWWNTKSRPAEATAIDVIFPAGIYLNKSL